MQLGSAILQLADGNEGVLILVIFVIVWVIGAAATAMKKLKQMPRVPREWERPIATPPSAMPPRLNVREPRAVIQMIPAPSRVAAARGSLPPLSFAVRQKPVRPQ